MRMILTTLILVSLLTGLAGADVIYLRSGGRVEGKIVGETATSLRVVVSFGRTEIPRDQVVRIVKALTPGELFAEKRAQLAPDEVEGLYELALWARTRKVRREAHAAFEEVVRLDPDHAGARKALGHERYLGQWMTHAEVMRARGFVRYDGQWKSAEEVAQLKALEANRLKMKALQKVVNSLVARMGSRSSRVREAAYNDLVTLARTERIPGLVEGANRVRDYYTRVRVARRRIVADVRVQNQQLLGFRQVPTTLGQTGGTGFGTGNPVMIELPQTRYMGYSGTVVLPGR